MTVLLVLFTLILFLAADHFVQKSRRSRVLAQARQRLVLPDDVALASNHTWIRKDRLGTITLGLDELMGKLVGAIDEIILPSVDSSITPARATISIRQGGKTLSFAPPVAGRVVEVNTRVRNEPRLARHRPYDEGWLVRIQPATVAPRESRTGNAANAWLKEQAERVKEFLAARSAHNEPAFLQDGGLPAAGVLSGFAINVWHEFEREFVALPEQMNSRKEV